MNEDKIQTGLRIPQSRYDELKDMADKAGISLNAMILFLDAFSSVWNAWAKRVPRTSLCMASPPFRPE